MKKLSIALKMGARSSDLALLQAQEMVAEFGRLLPVISFEIAPMFSPGDRDHVSDLRDCAPDFFTQDLDLAVLNKTLDCAVHSAKDLPDPVPKGLDWFWLPTAFDSRDAIILPKGLSLDELPDRPRVGVSSVRRATYTEQRFPDATMLSIRGDIGERLQQLDAGKFDVLIMAGVALLRLGMDDRITEWIPLDQLPTPVGQGRLAITFREGDIRLVRMRSLFVKPVIFVGAGSGGTGLCTIEGKHALEHCDVCLYDALVDPEILNWLPSDAKKIFVGKRGGLDSVSQDDICALLLQHSRRGDRVVRLKGGDPGLFGRLAEEVDAFDDLQLPYRVVPGISSFVAATTGTGLLATRRGVSRGVTLLTPRKAGGGVCAVDSESRAGLPLVFFMAGRVLADVVNGLQDDGKKNDLPATVVFNSGCDNEFIVASCLENIVMKVSETVKMHDDLLGSPSLLLVGETVANKYLYKHWGAFSDSRILLTCSSVLMDRAARTVMSYGGKPLRYSMIKLLPEYSALEIIPKLLSYDWMVLTSPAAVDCLMLLMKKANQGIRTLPRILAGGPKTAERLRRHMIVPDAAPDSEYGMSILYKLAAEVIETGSNVVRFRSDKADDSLVNALNEMGHKVVDTVLYRNEPVQYDRCPDFDAVIFASGSAVESLVQNWGVDVLTDKQIAVIGNPTAEVLASFGVTPTVLAGQITVDGIIQSLAACYIERRMVNAR